MMIKIAPAKINLYLHVGGVRADGLHDLASLFVFADAGDRLYAKLADQLELTITGTFAQALSEFPVADNLILKAANALIAQTGYKGGAHITLEKELPIAAGIGGGSADAAAALLCLNELWGLSLTKEKLADIAFQLGADVPACLSAQPVHVSGAGETVTRAPRLPKLSICLVNPGVATPTGPIFTAFDQENPSPAQPTLMEWAPELDPIAFCAQLEAVTRNDLQAPAIAHVREIAQTLDLLSGTKGCLLARMSGSGATCFGLFADDNEARHAAQIASEKGYWSLAGALQR